jgi:GNAT superfamily N-acetyltransferase
MYDSPVLLTASHSLATFDCGDPSLNTWLSDRALAKQANGGSRTWVVLNEGHVIAFYSSAAAAIFRADATPRARRNQPEPIPAILLGRLAVDQKHQGRGVGRGLVKHCILKALEVSQSVGVRLLVVHAKDDLARNYYLHFEFESSPIDEKTLMLVLHDAEEAILHP